MAEIDGTMLEIIKEHAIGLTGDLTRDTAISDLGIDSFAIVEIIYEVEERVGIEIPFNANDNPLADMKSVGDLVDAVKALAGQE